MIKAELMFWRQKECPVDWSNGSSVSISGVRRDYRRYDAQEYIIAV